jgi:BirA family biotin operon repressor/biotin-[acetyl-CoA-carboxylase] ligase
MELVQQGIAGHGYAVFADEQTAGKGQRGKAWLANPCDNIMVSIVLDTSFLSLQNQFSLSAIVALAVHDLFAAFGDDFRIKWPNDLYWQQKKMGGILIENIVRGNDWKWAIVGIGLNINQTEFPDHLKNPVSLKLLTGRHFDTVALARQLCDCLQKRYSQLKNDSLPLLLQDYQARLFMLNQQAKLKKGNIVFPALILGVSPMGKLLAESAIQAEFDFGEVEWLF